MVSNRNETMMGRKQMSTIVGMETTAKLVTQVMPGFPRLKEWAHAGIFFLTLNEVMK
jgi:hypothetical protein